MNLQERMKKYAKLGSFVPNTPTSFMWRDKRIKAFPEVLADLQATVRALQVARDNLEELNDMDDISFVNDDEYRYHKLWVRQALQLINQTFGKVGV